MKVNSVLLIVFCLFALNCKKQPNVETQTATLQNQTQPAQRLDESVPLIPNPNNVLDYIDNPNDADDEKIQGNLHAISIAMRNLFKSSTYNSIILNAAANNDNNCINIHNFISSAMNISNPTNFNFENLDSLVTSKDLTHRVYDSANVETVEQYIPAIHVVNISTANSTKMPIISSGIYVTADIQGIEHADEYIVAWYFSLDDNTFHEILINEETAMSTTHPIFVIDNAESAITNNPKSEGVPEIQGKSANQNTAYFDTYEHKLNYRYENTNWTELAITTVRINAQYVYLQYGGNGTKKIMDIHKNNMNSTHLKWELLAGSTAPYSTTAVFWNTYERDWAKSEKTLGTVDRFGKSYTLSGRRTYSNEWYAFDPGATNSNPLDLFFIYDNWAKYYTNWKSSFRVWRMQP